MKAIILKRSGLRKIFDFQILFSVIFLVLMGLYCILSKTYGSEEITVFYNYLNFVILGLILFLIITFLPEKFIYSLSSPIYFLVLILLFLVLVIGHEISGTKGWFRLGGFSFQPAEFAKLATIMVSAYILSIEGVTVTNVRGLLLLIGIFVAPLTLIVLQPDFGTAIVMFGILWGLLFWAGLNLNFLLVLIGMPIATLFYLKGIFEFVLIVAIFFAVLYYFNRPKILPIIISMAIIVGLAIPSRQLIHFLPAHQQARIRVFIDPTFEPTAKSYNIIQSVLAVGSGGLLGKGVFKGTQTQLGFVIAQASDFAFSIPAEEFGFAGAILIILTFLILIRRIVQIGLQSNSLFFRYINLGYSFLLIIHFVENIGMVIGLFPVMGIPLPFISKGGSFLMVNFILVGIAMNSYRRLQQR
ncbi:MAG: FtsW/RodA/SpoVE family cell cycle protein [Candidatus Kapaibacteriales bacterium]